MSLSSSFLSYHNSALGLYLALYSEITPADHLRVGDLNPVNLLQDLPPGPSFWPKICIKSYASITVSFIQQSLLPGPSPNARYQSWLYGLLTHNSCRFFCGWFCVRFALSSFQEWDSLNLMFYILAWQNNARLLSRSTHLTNFWPSIWPIFDIERNDLWVYS